MSVNESCITSIYDDNGGLVMVHGSFLEFWILIGHGILLIVAAAARVDRRSFKHERDDHHLHQSWPGMPFVLVGWREAMPPARRGGEIRATSCTGSAPASDGSNAHGEGWSTVVLISAIVCSVAGNNVFIYGCICHAWSIYIKVIYLMYMKMVMCFNCCC